MARVGRGKNTFSEDYTTHHLLISLSFPSPPSLRGGSYFLHPHTTVLTTFPGFNHTDAPQEQGRRRPSHCTTPPASSAAAVRHNHILASLTLSTRPTGQHRGSTGGHQRSTITLYLAQLCYLNYSRGSSLLHTLAQSHPKWL